MHLHFCDRTVLPWTVAVHDTVRKIKLPLDRTTDFPLTTDDREKKNKCASAGLSICLPARTQVEISERRSSNDTACLETTNEQVRQATCQRESVNLLP